MNTFRLIDLVRQAGHLTGKGDSVSDALGKLEKQLGSGAQGEIQTMRKIFDSDDTSDVIVQKFRHASTLNRLVRQTKQYRGDVARLLEGFNIAFLKQDSAFDIETFDSSGLLTYLIAVVLVAVITASVYVIFVLPEFEQVFSDFGHDLPALTSLVLSLNSSYSLAILFILMGLLVFIIHVIVKTRRTIRNLDCFSGFYLKLPLVSVLLKRYNQYLQLRFVALLIHAGLEPENACKAISEGFGDELELRLEQGQPVTTTYSAVSGMRDMLEMSHRLGTFSEELAYQIQELEKNALKELSSVKAAVAVIMILVVATIVGTLIISMYLPIFQFGKVIGGG